MSDGCFFPSFSLLNWKDVVASVGKTLRYESPHVFQLSQPKEDMRYHITVVCVLVWAAFNLIHCRQDAHVSKSSKETQPQIQVKIERLTRW